MNLVFCGNKKAYDGILLALLSIIKHTSRVINVYILTMDLSKTNPLYLKITEEQINTLNQIVQEKNRDSRIILLDIIDVFLEWSKDCVNLDNVYTPYAMARLFLDILPVPDKVLYLDTDVLANQDIAKLYDKDITNYELAAVEDYYGVWFLKDYYINAGVMLLNLDMIRKNGLLVHTRERCKKKKYPFPDQDSLNYCVKKILYLKPKYNSQRRYHSTDVIQHFCKSIRWFPWFHTINIKPWQIELLHQKYKNHHFDDVLDEYLRIKGEDRDV